ncbi:MAG TPA: FliM/FliN family flagellar motor C-terminal domain-containing protein [Terriglobales bacterium]|nr:FliM/FliN family flagellar motor C-terminal domain-containing protein [Terriglobales bacterium]
MATHSQPTVSTPNPAIAAAAANAQAAASAQAAVPPAAPRAAGVATAPAPPPAEADIWEQLQWLSCNLSVELSVPRVTVGDVLRLSPNSVVETRWQQNADVPIRANGELLAWAEFEGVDEKLAVRVTRIA